MPLPLGYAPVYFCFNTYCVIHIITRFVQSQPFLHDLCYFLYMNNFATKLKSLRKEHNLTLKQTSSALGLTTSAFSNYENGIREPSLDCLRNICKLFNVSADYLLDLSDER